MTLHAHILFPELDLKADDVMFIEGTGWQPTLQLLCKSPQKIDGGFKLKGGYYPIMRSQPLPSPFLWDDSPTFVELYRLCLAGLSNGKHSLFVQYRSLVHRCYLEAQWVGKKPSMRDTSEHALRAPEVILGADYGVKVDIWAIGCMVFPIPSFLLLSLKCVS